MVNAMVISRLPQKLAGAGLGLRHENIAALVKTLPKTIDFLELAPENWLSVGGRRGKQLQLLVRHYPIICHGLSLSLGSPDPLDEKLIANIKKFLNRFECPIYSEHLSYCSAQSHLYNLMPLPFTEEAAYYIAKRIKQVQEKLQRRIAVENITYYYTPQQELTELEFIKLILEEADCELLLDVNNVYVNSKNHGYDANDFIRQLANFPIAYIHVAGHIQQDDNIIIDNHGADVIDPVWQLLQTAYQIFGVYPTLLERDFNLPPLSEQIKELNIIKALQKQEQYYVKQCP